MATTQKAAAEKAAETVIEATEPTAADVLAGAPAEVQAANLATGETEVDPKVADLQAQIESLQAELVRKSATVQVGEDDVWVVNADGSAIQGVPYCPKSWLGTHLLPAGARKATAQEQETLEAVEVARKRPLL